jgi:hypothetical protein
MPDALDQLLEGMKGQKLGAKPAKVASRAQVALYAKRKAVSLEAARKEFKEYGYTIR